MLYYGHAWHDANHIDVILCINNDASKFSLKVWGLAYEIGDEDWEGGVSQNLANSTELTSESNLALFINFSLSL